MTDLEYLARTLHATQAARSGAQANADRLRGAIYTLSTQEITAEAWRVFTDELWTVVMGAVLPGEHAEQTLWLQEGKRQLALQILLAGKDKE
jgi:hypothetical protein